jgi:flavin reductase (DIM6/NTAB) family NADH-FMN oxidoreductase RutF
MVTGEELRSAMRRFPAGVCVVSVDDEGTPRGATVGSLVSLSLEPPLVGISVGHQSSLHLPLRGAGRFAVSILGGDQAAVAQHFARSAPPIAQWDRLLRPDAPAGGAREPLVADALAWLACAVASEHEAGDHTIFVGRVESVELGRPREPLAYLAGRYRSL